MRYDDYAAGVDLFRATGSLIAQPQRIVPMIILPAIRLWVPVERQEDYPAGIWMMNDAYLEPISAAPDVGPMTWRNDVGIAPPLTMAALERTLAGLTAVPDVVPPIPERYLGSRITFSYPSPEMDAAARRFEAAMAALFDPAASVPNLGQHTPADDDLVATLLDYARAGDAEGFRALALMRGVPAEEIATMWDGTVKRVGK